MEGRATARSSSLAGGCRGAIPSEHQHQWQGATRSCRLPSIRESSLWPRTGQLHVAGSLQPTSKISPGSPLQFAEFSLCLRSAQLTRKPASGACCAVDHSRAERHYSQLLSSHIISSHSDTPAAGSGSPPPEDPLSPPHATSNRVDKRTALMVIGLFMVCPA